MIRHSVSALLLAAVSSASTTTWVVPVGTPASITDPASWSPILPNTNEQADINAGLATMSSGSFAAKALTLGGSGVTTFTQTGGTITLNPDYGNFQGGPGNVTVNLSGGVLNTGSEAFFGGTATINQSAGQNNTGSLAGFSNYYLSNMAALTLTFDLTVTRSAPDPAPLFQQTGTSTLSARDIVVGTNGQGNGTFDLQSGTVTARALYIAKNSGNAFPPTGLFKQSGGSFTAQFLSISPGGTAEFTGGSTTLSAFQSQGTLDFKNAAVTIAFTANSFVDLSSGTIANAANATITVGTNSITQVSPDVDPASLVGHFSTLGILHTAGTELYIPAGTSSYLTGTFSDPLRIAGTLLTGTGGTLTLNGPLKVEGGTIDTSANPTTFNINDPDSGISTGTIGGTIYNRTLNINNGTFTQSGGTADMNVTLGNLTGTNGTYLFSGGTLTFTGITLGSYYSTSGTFTQTGGNAAGNVVAVGSLGTGAYTLSGNSTLVLSRSYYAPGQYSLADFRIGGLNTGVFTQNGGVVSVDGSTEIACNRDVTGTYILNDGSFKTTSLSMGQGGTALFKQYGGTAQVTGNFQIGFANPQTTLTPNATYSLYGGTLSANLVEVGKNSIGKLEIAGGTLSADTILTPNNGSTLSISAGSATANYVRILLGDKIILSGGTLNIVKQLDVTGKIDFANGPGTLSLGANANAYLESATLSNYSHAILVGGPNSLFELPAGINLDTFASIQSQGIVHVAGTPLSIPNGTNIGGIGTITGQTTNSGNISPGYSPGFLTITGNYVQSAAGSLTIELGGNNFGNDFLSISGTASLSGILNVRLYQGYVPAPADSIKILSASQVTGTFANANPTVTFSGGSFSVYYDTTGVYLYQFQPAVNTPASGFWVNSANNNLWNTNTGPNSNWSGGFPSAVDNVATFGDLATPGVINLGTAKTLGGILINPTAGNYTLGTAASPAITLQATTGSATLIASGAGSHTVAAKVIAASDVTITANTSLALTGGLDNTAGKTVSINGTASFTASSIANTGVVNVSSGTKALGSVDGAAGVTAADLSAVGTLTILNNTAAVASRVRQNTLNISGTAQSPALLTIAESSPGLASGVPSGSDNAVSVLRTLTIDGDGAGAYYGALDLKNNDLIIDYTGGTSPLAAVEALVHAGYNNGLWTGTGVTSSTAATNSLYSLVVLDNAAAIVPFNSFDNIDTSSHQQVIVKFSWAADLNLDGVVTTADAVIFAAFYDAGQPATHRTGDLNYNGVYDLGDAVLFAAKYDASLPHLPEPASLTLLLAGVVPLLTRRRR